MNKEDVTLAFVALERTTFLVQSLASVKGFPNIIVYDNGSQSPNSKMLIKASAAKHKAKFIRSETNDGLPRAWNQCIIEAKTDWVALCPDDVIFKSDWLEQVSLILLFYPDKKIVFGNNYNMILMHKSIIPIFGWWEERYKQYPSSEDYDFHLRLSELMGFSPYTMPGDHIQGAERQVRLARKTTLEQAFDAKNFTYWFSWDFGNPPSTLCDEIPHPRTATYFKKNEAQETGYDFHARKWEVCTPTTPGALLNIDGQYWKRLLPDINPYPEITEEYRKKYL